MKREIKFRMFSIKDKFMDDTPVIYKGAPCTIDTEGKVVWMSEDDTILMQYTGLHDSKGKEIYESDIVKIEGWSEPIQEVIFNRGGFCTIRLGEESTSFAHDIKYSVGGVVIGNKYETPYLLTP